MLDRDMVELLESVSNIGTKVIETCEITLPSELRKLWDDKSLGIQDHSLSLWEKFVSKVSA